MKSPASTPASIAGVSSIGVMTDEAVFLRHLDAEPAEFAAGLHLHASKSRGGR
jgi:hypothetical protein